MNSDPDQDQKYRQQWHRPMSIRLVWSIGSTIGNLPDDKTPAEVILLGAQRMLDSVITKRGVGVGNVYRAEIVNECDGEFVVKFIGPAGLMFWVIETIMQGGTNRSLEDAATALCLQYEDVHS